MRKNFIILFLFILILFGCNSRIKIKDKDSPFDWLPHRSKVIVLDIADGDWIAQIGSVGEPPQIRINPILIWNLGESFPKELQPKVSIQPEERRIFVGGNTYQTEAQWGEVFVVFPNEKGLIKIGKLKPVDRYYREGELKVLLKNMLIKSDKVSLPGRQ